MLKWCKSVVDEAAVRDDRDLCLWPAAQVNMPEGCLLSTAGHAMGSNIMGHCSIEMARVLVQLRWRPCSSSLGSIAQACTAERVPGAS